MVSGLRMVVIALVVVLAGSAAEATTAAFHGWETLPSETFLASGRTGFEVVWPAPEADREPTAQQAEPTLVPEPATMCLVAVGLSGMFVRRRKHRGGAGPRRA